MAALEGMGRKRGRESVGLGKVWKAMLQSLMFTTGEDERDQQSGSLALYKSAPFDFFHDQYYSYTNFFPLKMKQRQKEGKGMVSGSW